MRELVSFMLALSPRKIVRYMNRNRNSIKVYISYNNLECLPCVNTCMIHHI
jgi:hypothetical protein